VIGNGNIMTIQQFKSGKFNTTYTTIKIKLIGVPFPIGEVLVHDEMSDPSPVKIAADNTIVVSKEFSKIQIMAKQGRSRIKKQKKS
jgi:alpha-glucosidase